jgi:hypothetical protein
MNRSPTRLTQALLALALVGASAVPAATNAEAATPFCGIHWGSQNKLLNRHAATPITNVRAGRHACFDRLVVDLRGKNGASYSVRYVRAVRNQGQGAPIPLRGGARLEIVITAPTYDANNIQTYRFANRKELNNVTGFATFRQVGYGGSFEGYTTIGLGVRARLPMHAFILNSPGGDSHVVIDVAHHW